MGSDFQRATRITYAVQRFDIIADGGSFALHFTVLGVQVTTAPLNLLTAGKDDITKAIVDATGGVNTPFSDWTYYSHCDLPGYTPTQCGWSSDVGTDFSSDPPAIGNYDDLFWNLFWVMDYKGGQSGFRVAGNANNAAIFNSDTKTAAFWLIFFGPASSSLSDIEIVTRSTHPLSAPSQLTLSTHSHHPPSQPTLNTTNSGTTRSGITFATTSSNHSHPVKAIQKTVQEGSTDPFYWPAPMDFFRTALPLTPVSVTSNGLRAVCNHVLPVCLSALTFLPPVVYHVQTDVS